MSQKNIESSLQSKLKNLVIQPKVYKDIFNQFFTEEIKEKVKAFLANPKELLPTLEQSKNDNNIAGSSMPTAKEDKQNQGHEEFDNNMTKEKQYSNLKQIYNLQTPSSNTGFICFLKGMFYETGYLNNYQEDCSKALVAYKEGLHVMLDSLCALKLAEIYSNSKIASKFGLKANHELAYAYLIIADAYLDAQYNNNLINLTKDVEQITPNFADQHKFAIENLKKHQNDIFTSFSELRATTEIEQINIFLSFKHSSQIESQTLYNQMINNLGSKDEARSLLLMIRILSNQTHNSNKQVKKIVELVKSFSIQTINQALQWILSDIHLLQVLERDHEVFNCVRTTFIEIFNVLKIISFDTQILIPYQPFEQNNMIEYNTIHAKINFISEILHRKKSIFKNQLHNVLVIRIRAEVLRKGIGVQQSYEQALKVIEEEKELKKGQQSLYAYYYYKKGKLLDKMNGANEDIQNSFNQSIELFIERLSSPDLTTQVLARYYLGRIYSQNNEQSRKAHEQFNLAVAEFKGNVEKFNQVKTFQFEILERKSQKRLENFDLSKLIESRMSRQSTQKIYNFEDGITLQLKVELVSKESNFVFFDQSIFEILEFIGKGEIGSTSLAKIKYDMLDEIESNIIKKQETLAQPHSNYMVNGQPRESKLKERVIIKQIPFNKNNYFDKIFHHLGKIQKINSGEGLLRLKGFCINQINDMAFELWIVYPKLDFNLYAVIKQNYLQNDSQRVSFALQLAESLKNLHENNSYHGNIKPSNILMDTQHKVYFNDWEFSSKMYHKEKIIKNSQSKSKKKDESASESPNIEDDDSIDKNPLYSDGYIAPEIYQNPQRGQFTGALTDIWGLGMILYYLFSGKDPSFCGLIQEQQIYDKNDLKVSRDLIPNQVIRELIESMVKYDPLQRASIQKVRDILMNQSFKVSSQH